MAGFTLIDQARYDAGIDAARGRPLPALEEEVTRLSARMERCAEQAGDDWDYSKIEEVGGSTPTEKMEHLQNLHTDLSIAQDALSEKREVKAKADALKERNAVTATPDTGVDDAALNAAIERAMNEYRTNPTGGDQNRLYNRTVEGLRDQFDGMTPLEAAEANNGGGHGFDIAVRSGANVMATLFELGGSAASGVNPGWPPDTTPMPGFVPYPAHPIQVIDMFPKGETSQTAIPYYEETVFGSSSSAGTPAAAERREAAALAESEWRFELRTEAIKSIGHQIPVTMEQLEDAPQVRRILNQRMGLGVRMRLDGQLLNGNSSTNPVHLNGLLNRTGILTQAAGQNEKALNVLLKAKTKVALDGRAMCNFYAMHHNDWTGIQLLETTAAGYYLGSPANAFQPRIWGLPVALTDHLTEGTAISGDFAQFSEMTIRHNVRVEFGMSADDFVKLLYRIRAYMRVALCVYRAKAFVKITGI